jgi:hypothetical protein
MWSHGEVVKLVKQLEGAGWNSKLRKPRPPKLLTKLKKRYGDLPLDFVVFLECVEDLASGNDQTFFCTETVFRKRYKFHADTFEEMSLDAADDKDEEREIRDFWSTHLVVFIALASGYDYIALEKQKAGTLGPIVHGYEPEFEEVELIYPSFEAFFRAIVRGVVTKKMPSKLKWGVF